MRPQRERGNYIAEWYGFRVWPRVDDSLTARRFQVERNCPFLTSATSVETKCKKQGRTGVCTVSSNSNGVRQDWLACPFRILDPHFTLLESVVRRLYRVLPSEEVVLRPLVGLATPAVYSQVDTALRTGASRVFIFSQQELGGEVKIPQTQGSPGIEVDVSVVELLPGSGGGFRLGQYLFFELQTMDFHGSPLHATRRFEEARDADRDGFHSAISAHPEWAGERVEGPNKANVFKRTIYQTIFEIQLSRTSDCAGFAIALPEPVWDSWRTHLGLPELQQDGDIWRLRTPFSADGGSGGGLVEPDRAWIFVFDIDRESQESPLPLRILRPIVTTSADLMHYTFERAPEQALAAGALPRYRRALEARLRAAWLRGPTSSV
jgi:hypothetical protein